MSFGYPPCLLAHRIERPFGLPLIDFLHQHCSKEVGLLLAAREFLEETPVRTSKKVYTVEAALRLLEHVDLEEAFDQVLCEGAQECARTDLFDEVFQEAIEVTFARWADQAEYAVELHKELEELAFAMQDGDSSS